MSEVSNPALIEANNFSYPWSFKFIYLIKERKRKEMMQIGVENQWIIKQKNREENQCNQKFVHWED